MESSLEHQALEADIDRLAGEVLRHKEHPELHGASDREILKHAIRSAVHMHASTPSVAPATDEQALPSYMANVAPEEKLETEYLIDRALHEGLAKVSREVLKAAPLVQDAFHDSLAGKLYPELERRGLFR